MRQVIAVLPREEVESLMLIRTKIGCARQALQNVVDGTNEEKEFYIRVTIDSLGTYQWLEQDWWNNINRTYKCDRNAFIDFNTYELYYAL